jgi:hypothetical protein
MSFFQYIGLGVFGFLVAVNLRSLYRGHSARGASLAWLSVLCAGAAAMIAPNETTRIARSLGIQRGADLLLYTSILAGLVMFFLIYTRMRKFDRQITLIVRRFAIDNAQAPTGLGAMVSEVRDGLEAEAERFGEESSPIAGSAAEDASS